MSRFAPLLAGAVAASTRKANRGAKGIEAARRAIKTAGLRARGRRTTGARGRQSRRKGQKKKRLRPHKAIPKGSRQMANQYKHARDLMSEQDVSKAPKAYALLEEATKNGDQRATYAIGTWYLHGFFLKRDVRRGVALIAEAADQQVADAAFDLAVCYELGTGRRANINKALCYYMRSFLLGYPPSCARIRAHFVLGRSLNPKSPVVSRI
jgi:TPR repeat protein